MQTIVFQARVTQWGLHLIFAWAEQNSNCEFSTRPYYYSCFSGWIIIFSSWYRPKLFYFKVFFWFEWNLIKIDFEFDFKMTIDASPQITKVWLHEIILLPIAFDTFGCLLIFFLMANDRGIFAFSPRQYPQFSLLVRQGEAGQDGT